MNPDDSDGGTDCYCNERFFNPLNGTVDLKSIKGLMLVYALNIEDFLLEQGLTPRRDFQAVDVLSMAMPLVAQNHNIGADLNFRIM